MLQHVGVSLRALHGLHAPDCLGRLAYDYLGAHQPMEPQPPWVAAFAVMWRKLLDDVVACGCYTPTEANRLRDLFTAYRAHFDRPVAASLLHIDVWSENILVDGLGNLSEALGLGPCQLNGRDSEPCLISAAAIQSCTTRTMQVSRFDA